MIISGMTHERYCSLSVGAGVSVALVWSGWGADGVGICSGIRCGNPSACDVESDVEETSHREYGLYVEQSECGRRADSAIVYQC